MRDQRAQIAGTRIGYPDDRKALLAQQGQHLARVATIGLRSTDNRGPNLCGIADDERVSQSVHDVVKPKGVPVLSIPTVTGRARLL